MNTTTWIPALALMLSTTALGGCRDPRPTQAAMPMAPALTEQTSRLAPTPPASCATPAPAAQAPAAQARRDDPAVKAPRASKPAAVELKVKRLLLAEAIEGREPVEAKSSFNAKDAKRVYAFVEVENPGAEESEITVTFEPPGGAAAKGHVSLDVGASRRWRTWAFTRGASTPGSWTAVVRGPRGEELARAPFEVTL